MTNKQMVEAFQCPGCVCGSDVTCGHYKWDSVWLRCTSHVLGTMRGLGNSFALGLPKGFCKPGWDFTKDPPRSRNTIDVRLWTTGTAPDWDSFNVAVWALERDGFLFVRTFAPRVNITWVDVIEGGTLAMVPLAINVATFLDQMD